MKVLRARLFDVRQQEYQAKITQSRKAQVGSGDRSEKIRTYNFPQDRITDHRIKKSFHNIEEIMEGKLEPIISALQELKY